MKMVYASSILLISDDVHVAEDDWPCDDLLINLRDPTPGMGIFIGFRCYGSCLCGKSKNWILGKSWGNWFVTLVD